MSKKVLYISSNQATFVQKDLDLIARWYPTDYAAHDWRQKKTVPLLFIKQFFWLLFRLPKAQAVMVMFAGFWSIWPVVLAPLFKVPVYVIVGGTEVMSYPQISYGTLRKPLWAKLVRFTFKRATRLLPVHEKLAFHQDAFFDNSKQGFKHHFPDLTTPYTVIHNGFPVEQYPPPPMDNRQAQSFITVAFVPNQMNFAVKGVKLILNTAPLMPEAKFTIVGMSEDFKNSLSSIPKNVRILGPRSQAEFQTELYQHRFYLQLSISEGFPNALCEAMLSGCVPIVSEVTSLPEIIGDTGAVVPLNQAETAAEVFRAMASRSSNDLDLLAQKARKKVMNDYPLEKRAQAFHKLLKRS